MESTSTAQRCLQNQESGTRVAQNYLASLHLTRKQPAKPWKKPATTPVNTSHPKVYQVEPVNFKELVQKLTGAPVLQSESRGQTVVAAPIGRRPLIEALDRTTEPPKISHVAAKDVSLGFDLLSPRSARFWEAFPLLSPSNPSKW